MMKHACVPYFDLVRKMESERRCSNKPRVEYPVGRVFCVWKQTEDNCATWERNLREVFRSLPLRSLELELELWISL